MAEKWGKSPEGGSTWDVGPYVTVFGHLSPHFAGEAKIYFSAIFPSQSVAGQRDRKLKYGPTVVYMGQLPERPKPKAQPCAKQRPSSRIASPKISQCASYCLQQTSIRKEKHDFNTHIHRT